MTFLIVDDEQLARRRLARMLGSLGHTDVTEACNAEAAIDAAESGMFDAVFLDIDMPGMNGVDLAYELRHRHPGLYLVFQTAYSDHALEAFDIGATGYLVKPYSLEQLAKTLERIDAPERADEPVRILSRNAETFYLLRPEEIYYIKADLSEVMIRSKKGFSYYARKISELEPLLAKHGFVRVHRSYLINTEKIREMTTVEQSKIRFRFDGIADEVESSKDGAKHFRNRFAG